MRKNVFGRQFKRDHNERKALFKSLLTSLVLYESIQTSEAKAKAIKADADKLITKAKKGGLHGYRLVEPELATEAVKKLLTSIVPRFTDRQGGYTRIIRVGRRLKDNSQEVMLEWTVKAKEIAVKDVKADMKKEEKRDKNTTSTKRTTGITDKKGSISAKASSFVKATEDKPAGKGGKK